MNEEERKTISYIMRLRDGLVGLKYQDVVKGIDSFMPALVMHRVHSRQIPSHGGIGLTRAHPNMIYKARSNESLDSHWTEFHEIGIVPEWKAAKVEWGRCNQAGERKFYASSECTTALGECVTRGFTEGIPGKRLLTIGAWKVNEPLNMARIGFSESSLKRLLDPSHPRVQGLIDYASAQNAEVIEHLSYLGHGSKEYLHQVSSVWADAFARTDITGHHDYMFSNYWCDAVFDRMTTQDGVTPYDAVLYPSVANSYEEMNIAVHPRAMHKLEFLSAAEVLVRYDPKRNKMKFDVIQKNVRAVDGKLKWRYRVIPPSAQL